MTRPARVFAAAVTLLAGIAVLPAGATDTIFGILANPGAYNRKHVEVSGTVASLALLAPPNGNLYETFNLCAGPKCIPVLIFGHPPLANGMLVNVAGTFSNTKQGVSIQATSAVR
jgi:hypothetical protein